MRRWYWAVLATLLLLGSCSRTPTTEIPSLPEFLLPQGDRRPVEVVFASPTTELRETPDGALITLVFNQAMVPLAGLGASPAIPTIGLNPALPGHWEWRGTATLVFVPDARPPDATRFTVTVPAGLKSFVGETLAKDYTFEFTTPKPALLRSVPANEGRFVRTDANLLLVFNQPVAEGATLVLQSGDVRVPVTARRPTDAERKDLAEDDQDPPAADTVLVVDPSESLALGRNYKLTISGLGMEKDATVRFRTVDVLSVKGVTSDEKWRPDGSILVEFSNPVSPKELVENLKISPSVKIPEWYAEDDYARQEIWLYLPLEARTAYRLTIQKDLEDEFGQKLQQPKEASFTTTDFSPALSMPEGLGILEAGGDLRLPVGLLNVKDLRVRMALLDEDEIVPLLDDGFYRDGFEPPGGFESDEEWRPEVPLNERVDRPVDLRKVLGGKTHGFVFVEVSTRVGSATWSRRALIQVSDLGLSTKFSPENTLIWTTTLGTGKPQAGVAVEIRGKDNRVLWTGRSDAQGLAKAPGWAELGLRKRETWESPVQYVFARAGDDATFVGSEGSSGISPWDFDIPYEWSPRARTYQGYGFTERGLYRAGEEVHFKGTVRRSRTGRWTVPDDVDSLSFTITDARDQKVQTGTVKLSDFGSFDHTLDLAETAPSGFYMISYRLPNDLRAELKEDGDLFSVGFRVEAYRPAQFEVKVEPGQAAYVLGDTAAAKITGRYLFGAAMSGDEVQWSARLEPSGFTPEGWAGFDFGPITFWNEDRRDQERVLVRDQGHLDAEGHREVSVSLKDIPFEGPASLVVEGTVTSASRQKISGRASVPVHPAAFTVGLKAGGSLQQSGKPVSVQVVSVDAAGKAVGGQKVDLQLIRRDWHSVRKAGAGGRYQWVSEAKDTDVSTASTTTGTTAVEVPVTPPKAGLYLVRATGTDAQGRKTVSETYFYAWGGDYVAWAREDEDRIEIVPDKKRYAPGDTARILVKSPYERAQALVTVERELVLDRYVVELEGTADTVEVPIRSSHLPNVFVSVLLVQGRVPGAGFGDDGMDLGKPSFKIGYANLPVEAAEKRLKVEVTTDRTEYEPRQEATVTVQVKDEKGNPAKGEVCLAVVDEGVLSLIGYGTPGYFDSFYGERPLSVRTAESRLDVIGQRSYGSKGDNQGGGGGLVGEYREDFVATAFWSPHLVTDDQGRAQAKFKLPDNLTRFRVMAVVQTMDSRFGSGEVGLTVQKPLLLQPSLPRFARRGDRFQAGVLVFNHTKQSGEVLIEAQTAGLQLGESKSQRVQVPAGQEKEVLFDFTAPDAGDAEVGFKASMGAHTDSLKLPIPVQRPVATEVVATSGTLDTAKAEEGLKLPGGILPGSAVLEAAVAGSSLAGLEGAVAELLDYPYGCLEQRLSRIVPLLVADELVTSLGVQDVDQAEIRRRVQTGLDELPQFQRESGGFSLWPGGEQIHDYLTAYAMATLHEAKAKGYKVDAQMVKRGVAYMAQAVNQTEFDYPYSRAESLTTRAYMLYALSLSGDAYDSTHSALFSVRDEMPLDGKVFLLRALPPDDPTGSTLERELTSAAKVEAQTAYFADPKPLPWIFGSNVRTTGLVLEALMERGEFAGIAPRVARWLMEARTDGHWGSTQEDVAALRALLAYAARYEKKDPDFTATIQVAGKAVLEERVRGRKAVATARVALDEASGDTVPLTITRDGKGTLHYDLRLRYAPTQEPPARDQGFTVFKTVRTLEGKPVVGTFEAGKTYRVTLTVLTPSERRYVAVNDPLPAGFEVVQTTFETESDEMRDVLKAGGVKHPWMGTFHHFEVEDSRVLLFADGLQAGEHTFEYLVRAMLPGQYGMPGTRAEEMYHPEVFGTTGAAAVEVR